MAGIDFFQTGEETTIKVVNLNDVTKNKELFEELLNETFLVKPVAQFYFERIDEVKNLVGTAINDAHYYSFNVKQVIEVLKKSGKDTTVWEKFNPELEIILIASSCEIIEPQEIPMDPLVQKEGNKLGVYLIQYLVQVQVIIVLNVEVCVVILNIQEGGKI